MILSFLRRLFCRHKWMPVQHHENKRLIVCVRCFALKWIKN